MKFQIVGCVSLGFILSAAAASAEVVPAEPSPEIDRGSEEAARADQETPSFKQLSIEANPLSFFIGRYSVNVEYLPALHHALVANPHYDNVSVEASAQAGDVERQVVDGFSGFGVELGYRYYTGRRGPNGFFIGPSFLLGRYSADQSDITGSEEKSFTSVGWALDLGGQAVIGDGFVIGGGFGLQQTKNSINADQFGELPLSAEILVGSGIRPRFLFSAGYAF